MAYNDLHAILIREAQVRVIDAKIEKARDEGRNDDFVDFLASKRRIEAEIREMKRS